MPRCPQKPDMSLSPAAEDSVPGQALRSPTAAVLESRVPWGVRELTLHHDSVVAALQPRICS